MESEVRPENARPRYEAADRGPAARQESFKQGIGARDAWGKDLHVGEPAKDLTSRRGRARGHEREEGEGDADGDGSPRESVAVDSLEELRRLVVERETV